MGDLMEPANRTPQPRAHAPPPIREDCWSQDATSTLVDAWGRKYLDLNRGNLRQKDWQDVADAVNAVHGHVKKARRTDVQCKNRIDTLKKKYKVEKARVSGSHHAALTSSWPFFDRLDPLIGHSVSAKKPLTPAPNVASAPPRASSVPVAVPLPPYRKAPPTPALAAPPVLPQKRRFSSAPGDESYFRQNYSALAAAAAAAAEADSEGEGNDSEGSRSSGSESGQKDGEAEGIRRLAQAIASFGEIYERVEGEKQRQIIELEKQRMQFSKDLEFQRMQMFMDTQLQLEKIKRSKRSGSGGDGMYS